VGSRRRKKYPRREKGEKLCRSKSPLCRQ